MLYKKFASSFSLGKKSASEFNSDRTFLGDSSPKRGPEIATIYEDIEKVYNTVVNNRNLKVYEIIWLWARAANRLPRAGMPGPRAWEDASLETYMRRLILYRSSLPRLLWNRG